MKGQVRKTKFTKFRCFFSFIAFQLTDILRIEFGAYISIQHLLISLQATK